MTPHPTPTASFVCFVLAATYSFWVLHWRCRPGTPYTDADGILWNRRAQVLVSASVVLVVVAAVNWVLTCHQ